MAVILDMFIRGVPKPQPRPRAFARRIGSKVTARVFDCGSAEGWKGDIANALRDRLPASPLAGPLKVSIEFHLPRPKGLCRKKDPAGPIPHHAKPDRDNLEKATLDAMTHLGFWHDDGQVCAGEVTKFYHSVDASPGAFIRVETLDA